MYNITECRNSAGTEKTPTDTAETRKGFAAMQDRNKVTLRIGGAEYTVRADEETAYILAVGEEVDTYVTQLMKDTPQISTTVAAVFAALEFCDRAHKADAAADNLRAQIRGYVEEAGRARLDVDEARREINRLNQQLQVMTVKLSRYENK